MLALKKKISVLTIVLLVSTMVCATETAYVKILLHGATNPTRSTSFLTLLEDDERTTAYEDGFDASALMLQSNSFSTLFFALLGGDTLAAVATNNLSSLALGFVSNQVDNTYTLSFEDFSGADILLWDKAVDTVITVNASTPPYVFTIPATQVGRVRVLDRFAIVAEPTAYQLCYTYGKFVVDNPGVATSIHILDSVGNFLSSYAVGAAKHVSIAPLGLIDGKLYQVVGLQNDTLFFRAQ